MTQTPITLKDGLILRAATTDDIEAIANFNSGIHIGPDDPEGEGEMLRQWTRDIASEAHPTADVSLFTVVVDPAVDNKIVSSMCLIPQTWHYAGVPFKFGRPELVGTLDEYRNRGLVRAQFEWHHQWCAEHDILVQGITGIPFFYRQFGYEYALNLEGGIKANQENLPLKVKEGKVEPCAFREATIEDIPFLIECEQNSADRNLITVLRDAERWQYEIEGMHPNNIYYRKIVIITTPENTPIGFYVHPNSLWGKTVSITRLELNPGHHWMKLLPAILRNVWSNGQAMASQKEKEECKSIRLSFGETHPAYTLCKQWFKETNPPYAWYMRVGDLPRFLQIIAPALEKQLVNSAFHGHTGDLKLSFYKKGVQITFDNGKISSVSSWQPTKEDGGNANFPNLTFLQLLFGYRTIKEIHHILPDIYARDANSGELLKILFPKVKNEELWMIS